MGIHDSLLLLSSDRSDVSRASTQLARIVLGVFMASLLRVIVYGGGWSWRAAGSFWVESHSPIRLLRHPRWLPRFGPTAANV